MTCKRLMSVFTVLCFIFGTIVSSMGTLTANALESYTVKVSVKGRGSVSGTGKKFIGERVVLTAKPEAGEQFYGWFNGETKLSENTKYEFFISEDTSLIAKFSGKTLVYKDDFIFFADEMTASTLFLEINILLAMLYDKDGNQLYSNTLVSTGSVLMYLKNGNSSVEYTLIMLGDINCDGKVTASDARMALRYSAGLNTLEDIEKIAADVDFDESITAIDARRILRVSAQLDSAEKWLNKIK